MVHTLCMFRDLCVRMDVYSHSECAASMRALIMKHSVCVCVCVYIYTDGKPVNRGPPRELERTPCMG